MKPKLPLRALLFDFDGVVLESVPIKTKVFRSLFTHHRKHLSAILQYHIDNSGVNRFEKFDHIYTDILHQPLSDHQKKILSKTFATRVFDKILACRFVRGASSFLKDFYEKIPLYILSATPEKELKEIIRRKNLKCFFKRVYGFPTSKIEAIQSILRLGSWAPKEVLYIGDARADWEAARRTGIRFIGRVPPGSSGLFPKSISCVRDLTSLQHLIERTYRV